MNQITGKVDYKQDLISVRLASINQIIDPWMYVIFRKGTFLKLLRRLRLFLTNRKQGAMSSMKQSHSCEDHRLKPLMHTRSQSCPPAVCYSVDGSMVPSVHVKDHLLPKDVFCGLSASARLSDDVEVVKRKPIQTLVPSEEVALRVGGVLSLPKALLDPRRPSIPSQETMEEGAIPYIPELPVSTENFINYNHSIFNVRGIHTAPAGLESTSLVLVYGTDIFCTRVMPSKMFDVLKEDFDYLFIAGVLAIMIFVSVISQKLAAKKALKRAWK
ncbi:hypothetical protein ACOMHN_029419 [Nucella lapillus]